MGAYHQLVARPSPPPPSHLPPAQNTFAIPPPLPRQVDRAYTVCTVQVPPSLSLLHLDKQERQIIIRGVGVKRKITQVQWLLRYMPAYFLFSI